MCTHFRESFQIAMMNHLSKSFYSVLDIFEQHSPFLESILTQIQFNSSPALRLYHPILPYMPRLNVHNRPLHPNISSKTLYKVRVPHPPFRASTFINQKSGKIPLLLPLDTNSYNTFHRSNHKKTSYYVNPINPDPGLHTCNPLHINGTAEA